MRWHRPTARLAHALAILAWLCAAPAAAQDPDPTRPVLLTADEMTYNQDLGIVTASGNVEISQFARVLRADAVTYNERTEVVTASGNVVLLEPTGEVIFAEYVELTDELSEGFIRGFRMLLQDDSRIAAAGGRRQGGVLTEMRRGVFSPCNLCPDDPERAPLWQIKAIRIVHDQEKHDVIYNDAWMEIAGIPVLYTPYLRHPDPTVNRRSGFLAPLIGQSSDLGFIVQPKYFFAIGDDKDITLDPIYTSNNGLVLSGEYRQAFNAGVFQGRTSATSDDRFDSSDDNRFRGHIDANTRFDLNETFRTGAVVRASSDDTYLKRYNILNDDVLTSNVFVEAFSGRNYADLRGQYFQSLRSSDDQDTIPIVAPDIDWYYIPDRSVLDGRLRFDANGLALTRSEGADSRRASLITDWQRTAIGGLGDVWKFQARLQTDIYNVDDVSQPSRSDTEDGFRGRVFPQALAELRYPLMRASGRTRQIIEPIGQLVLAPNGGNDDDIPNEDSLTVDLTDTNLFNPSRFPGRDRVEGGSRVDYGLRAGVYGLGGGSTSLFVGQSYRFRTDETFAPGTGLRDNFSDIVGRVAVTPGKYVDAVYRTRFDKDNLEASRSELEGKVGPRELNLKVDYVFFDANSDLNFGGREEINGTLRSQVTNFLSVAGSYRRDLENSESLSWGASVAYADECLTAQVDFGRSFFQNQDIEPTDSVFFRLVFKHLGEVRQQVL